MEEAIESGPLLEDVELVRDRVRERLAGVAGSVAVMSGKGGVGKSAVAVNLALALARDGARVGVLDADLQGPSVAKMLGLRGQPVRVGPEGLRPAPGPEGLCVQSMDFFLQGAQPLDWDGPAGEGAAMRSALEDAALGDLLGQTEWGELDVLVIDLAPGADRLPALARLHPGLTGALAVTIPTEVALLAVERSLRRAREAGIPLLGLVENMGSTVCTACGAEGPLFREASAESLARDLDVELLARIPFDPRLAASADEGRSFLAGGGSGTPAGRAFVRLADHVRRAVRAGARAVAATAFAAALGATPAQAAEEGWGYDLANELMSPYCPGRALPDCPSPQATELRQWIVAQEEAGRSEEEVKQQLLARFGDELLQSPKAEGFGLTAYLLPVAAVLVGAFFLLRFLRRQASATPATPGPRLAAVDPELERQVEEEMRRAEGRS